jgi:hypothetical protein
MRSIGAIVAASAAVVLCAGSAQAGPDWIEGEFDAGSTLSTAQQIVGVGELLVLFGSLSAGSPFGGLRSAPDYEDMYLLQIASPTLFSFTVGSANFDPQLFLFNITLPGEALGLLANNDTPMSNLPRLTSPATDATGAMVLLPGAYALGVSGVGRVPVSPTGPIFFFGSPTEVSGPDGPGGINPLSGWTGVGDVGDYEIRLEAVTWYNIPAPASGSLLLGGWMLARRRRR